MALGASGLLAGSGSPVQVAGRHNDGMQQTAPRVGRAANGGVDAAAACSLSLAAAPQLIPVFDGPYPSALPYDREADG